MPDVWKQMPLSHVLWCRISSFYCRTTAQA